MVYIDFDDVILSTGDVLFEDWRKDPNHHLFTEKDKIKYVSEADWNYILHNSKVINDSIDCLKNMDPNKSAILTKVHSLVNEGSYKVKWIRENNIKQSVILVPYNLKKTDMVMPSGNILIDDCLTNLDHWIDNGGIPILFDENNDNIDSWGVTNTKNYKKVLSLHEFVNRR